ncbi:hypothetical protein ACFQZZ_07265 [Nocardia sp. GCM10030253]|uniref:hypothetical protein n=1 Tax=Nocardia sp. GCM10030253 TaxID=3273404 RepID=UPI003626601E
MDHDEQGGDSIGALLSSLATTLREVSDKLDAVAARVDDDRDDRDVVERLAKLEAWAFRAGDDMAKLDSRLERVESGAAPSQDKSESATSGLDAGRPDSSKLPSRAQRRAATAIPPAGDQSERTPTAPFELPTSATRRDPAPAVTPDTRIEPAVPALRNARLEPPAPTAQNEQVEPATITPRAPRVESTATPFHNEPFGPATHSEPMGTRNSRVEQAPTFGNERLEPPAPSTRSEWLEATPSVHSERPEPRSSERLAPPAQASRNDWTEYSTPAAGNGRLESPTTAPHNDRVEHGTTGSSNGRVEYSAPASSNGRLETPALRPDSGMTAPRNDREENVAIPPGAHRAAATEDTTHVDKLQAMLDELKRNGPFGARPETPSQGEMPGIDPHFAVRTEG